MKPGRVGRAPPVGPGRHRPGPSLPLLGLGFAAGVGGYFLQHELPPAPWVWLAVAAAVTLALWWRALRWPAAVVVGFVWAHLWACQVLCEPLPEHLVRRDLTAVGHVASLPDEGPRATRFLFDIETLARDGEPVPFGGRVRLAWYRDGAAADRNQPPPLLAGQRWKLRLRLKPPHGFANPGGFDYERWLFQQQIAATGYVRDEPAAELLAAGPGRYRLARWRQSLRDRIVAVLGTGADAALVRALVLGDRDGLTPAQWEVFARTGTSHLIAISGLHVGLVAGLLYLAARWLWARAGPLALYLAAPRAGALAALAGALGYSALAGFAVSTQRALVMLAVVLLAVVAARTLRPPSALLLALAVVLAADPASMLSYGFWLSFGAVAVLLYALGRRLRPPGLPWRWGSAQWAVALGLLPMLLLFFGRASLVAPAVNLIAVPAFGILLPVILAGTLATLVTGWVLPLVLVGDGLELAYQGLAAISASPWATLVPGGRPGWVWLAAAAGVLLLLAPRGLPGRWLGLVLLLPLALVRPAAPAPGVARIALLDVGQGLAAVVRTASHVLVYDTGPRFPSGFNTGDAVIVPYLREIGVDHLDLLVASHADQDHAGGLAGLMDEIGVAELLSGEPAAVAEWLPAGAGPVAPCRRGQIWNWDGVELALLHPDGDGYDGNDSSCVLRVRTGRASLLLTGDIEAGVESRLVDLDGSGLTADILVAAHHGSATSTSAAFLDAVAPDLVLYSSGYANRFGFPAEEVQTRVAARGIRWLDTADSGALELMLRPSGEIIGPTRYRKIAGRVWRHQPGT